VKTTDSKNEEIVPTSDDEPSQKPKLKKVKIKVCNEVNIVAKKIESEETQGIWSKYGDMVKLMSSKQASVKPAPKPPLQVQAMDARKLKREGVIVDLKAMEVTATNSNQLTKCLGDTINNLMGVDNRQVYFLIYIPCY